MSAHTLALGLTAFLACAVEAIEALTVVVAVGVTRGWARALLAALCALVVLAAVVALAGPRLPALAELRPVRLVVGLIALYLGSQWLRKAVLRAAGRKALRDEHAAFERGRAKVAAGDDAAAFATAFSGVLTEGIEVVAIVLALGSGTTQTLTAAAGGALLAVLVVAGVGVAVRGPLERVPENTLKYLVGVMLTAFGIFWTGEGIGVAWPADDVALFYLAGIVLIGALSATGALRTRPAT
ncbi:MAG: hypothetical protein ABR975_13250 [Vulcanimicrobiaceae bacterium]